MKPWGRRPGDHGRADERGGGGGGGEPCAAGLRRGPPGTRGRQSGEHGPRGGGTGPAPRRQAPRPRPRTCRWGAHGGGRLARPAEAARSAAVTGGRSRWPPLSRTGPRRDCGARTPGRPPSLSPCTRGRPGGYRLSGCPDVTSFLPCAAKNRPALLAGDGVALPNSIKTWGKLLTPPAEALCRVSPNPSTPAPWCCAAQCQCGAGRTGEAGLTVRQRPERFLTRDESPAPQCRRPPRLCLRPSVCGV